VKAPSIEIQIIKTLSLPTVTQIRTSVLSRAYGTHLLSIKGEVGEDWEWEVVGHLENNALTRQKLAEKQQVAGW